MSSFRGIIVGWRICVMKMIAILALFAFLIVTAAALASAGTDALKAQANETDLAFTATLGFSK